MKKITIVFSALILILTSCSSDDENNSNENLILLKKSISTSSTGTVSTTDYLYDGNKIVSATTNSTKINYFYTNDLITKIEVSDLSQVVNNRFLFTYDNSQRLIQKLSLSFSDQNGVKEILEYNSDGSVSFNSYSGNLISQTELFQTGKYFFNNTNQMIKKEIYSGNGILTTTYDYDSKNNPFKNVLNMIYFIDFLSNKFNVVASETSMSGVVQSSGNTQYSYNSSNFPTTEITTSTSGSFQSSISVQYFY